jgi:hypothetical protein
MNFHFVNPIREVWNFFSQINFFLGVAFFRKGLINSLLHKQWESSMNFTMPTTRTLGLGAGAAALALGGLGCLFIGRKLAEHEDSDIRFKVLQKKCSTAVVIVLMLLSIVGVLVAGGSLMASAYWVGKAALMGTSVPSLALSLKIGGAGAVGAIFVRALLVLGEYALNRDVKLEHLPHRFFTVA